MPPTHRTMEASVKYINEMVPAVRGLAQKSKNVAPDRKESKMIAAWYDQVEDLLKWLENDAQMKVELKTPVDKLLSVMFGDAFCFPKEIKGRAMVLHNRFEIANWGGAPVQPQDVDMADDIASPPPTRSPVRSSRSNGDRAVKYPPANHPIWGVRGIMHGIALSIPNPGEGGKLEPIINPRYACRPSRRHGDNDIAVGSWWARKLVAKFHGAHEMHGAGIAGDKYSGAFSIVVSGAYSDVDEDHGNYLYYSAPQSSEHADPNTTKTSTALEQSCRTRQPVRVIRSAGTSRWSPRCGFRYDGLYEVTSMQRKTNKLRGSYNRFTLERLDDQDDIDLSRPTSTEVRLEGRIKDKF
ncbi:hypothetical protein LTR17_016866 [Elasticomyces elasticus]|nr:hypothetical protein LTR17_016866 [Elasticomyces elasticus]